LTKINVRSTISVLEWAGKSEKVTRSAIEMFSVKPCDARAKSVTGFRNSSSATCSKGAVRSPLRSLLSRRPLIAYTRANAADEDAY
jgi:hypothetical protein